MQKVVVVPHDRHWRAAFDAEASRVAAALGENAIAIHHIGSTAIPDIYAKPVIDLLVEVNDVSEIDRRSSAMQSIGYEVMGEYGIPGRRYFRKDNAAGIRTHQVHAFEAGSSEVKRHLAFRDYLRAHPEAAQKYSELKRRLAREHPENMDAYIDGKDEFIKEIDRRAANLLLAAVFLVLVGCGDSSQSVSNRTPDQPTNRNEVRLGVAYPHTLFVHCGVLGTTFGGRDWNANPPLTDGSGNPPPGWDENTEAGTMTLQSPEQAVFRSNSGNKTATFMLRPPGSPNPNENCE